MITELCKKCIQLISSCKKDNPIFYKLALVIIVLCAMGMPINSPWKFFVFAPTLALIIAGHFKNSLSSKALLLFAILAIAMNFIPTLKIDEGHYILITQDNRLIDPQEIIQQKKFTPGFSAESFWHYSALSKVVEGINFDGLSKVKVGAINDNIYNFYPGSSPWNRNLLPYIISYIFPKKAQGLNLGWQGQAFWPKGNAYEKVDHSNYTTKTLTENDIEKPIYFVSSFTSNNQALSPLKIQLEATPRMQIKEYAKIACSILLVLALLLYALSWNNYHNILIVLTIISIQIAYVMFYAPYLIFESRPLMGGCDGLVHYGFARQMLVGLKNLDFSIFLKGTENTFFFMPGMRYIRAIEMILFGDNFYGYTLFFCFIPYVIYLFFSHFFEKTVAFILIILLATPLNSFLCFAGLSNNFYLDIVIEGYGEALAYIAFIGGILQIFKKFSPYKLSFWGHFCLAIAVSIRPNLLLASAYLILVSTLWHIQNTIHHQKTIALSWLGFLPIMLIPLHNIVFGGEFVPLTKAADYAQNLIVHPSDYWHLLVSLFNVKYTFFLNTQNYYNAPQVLTGQNIQSLIKILLQFYEYFIVGGFIKIPLLWFVFKNAFKPGMLSKINILSIVTLLIGTPFLIYNASIRYTFIVWFLAFTVMLYDVFSKLSKKYNLNLIATHVS